MQQEVRTDLTDTKRGGKKRTGDWKLLFAATGNAAGASVERRRPLQIHAEAPGSWKLLLVLKHKSQTTVMQRKKPFPETFTDRILYILENASIWGNELHFYFWFSRDISITPREETLKKRNFQGANCWRVYDFIKIESFLPTTGALISESVKYSALLSHFSQADKGEEWARRGVESLISRESTGLIPGWMLL